MPVKIFFLLSFLILPILIFYFPLNKNIILSAVEIIVELILIIQIVIYISKNIEKSQLINLVLLFALFCVFFADTLYSLHVNKIIKNYAFLADCLYSVFAISLLFFLSVKLNIRRQKIFEFGLIFLIIFFVDVFLSYKFLLSPYLITYTPLYWKINGGFYMAITICIFSLILPIALRVSNRKTFWLLNLILLLLIADIAIRYQDAFVDTFNFSWAEYAWCMVFVGLFWHVFFTKDKKKLFIDDPLNLAPLISVRSLLALAICGASILFLMGFVMAKFYLFKTANDVCQILFLLYLFWTISNEFAIWLSLDLTNTLKNMFKATEKFDDKGIIQFNLKRVEYRNSIYEISKILDSYNGLVVQTNKMMNIVIETNKKATLLELASQVSHDIQSPLAALEITVSNLNNLNQGAEKLIKNSISRIRNICNNMLQKYRMSITNNGLNENIESNQDYLLYCLIEKIISEKRMQYFDRIEVNIEIQANEKDYFIFSNVDSNEIMRVLSNIINNAYESINHAGTIIIKLTKSDKYATIIIRDTGYGIPFEVLNRIGQKGESYGKLGGSGLGIYHAKTTLEKWGGFLTIDSKIDSGTIVKIYLPLPQQPSWAIDTINISKIARIIILDDDITIHQMWRNRFAVYSSNIELLHYSEPNQLADWVSINCNYFSETLFLIDYEFFYYNKTGLELIEKFSIQLQAILVTGHFETVELLNRCVKQEIKLLPKPLIKYIQIES